MLRNYFLLIFFLGTFCPVYAQHTSDIPNLYRRITIDVDNKPLGEVLELISKRGNFTFSYSGSAFNADSLVSVSASNAPVRDILDRIFQGRADYRESNQYVIIRSTMLHFAIEPEIIRTDSRHYLISGRVVDIKTQRAVPEASVYERRLLVSELTDKDGYFRLRIRGDFKSVILTVSKEAYRDTSMMFLSTVTIKPEGYRYDENDSLHYYASNLVERLGIGKFLVSARQRIQSLNIPAFLANSPFQASLSPGLSTHGIFSSQVVNKASLNVFGGYTAGVDGVELAGLFNINKGDVQHFQAAGLINLVGGSVRGFQAGGLINSVLDSIRGFQTAGVLNDVRKNAHGFQTAGVFNHVRKEFRGVQVGGVFNLVSGSAEGTQIAGVGNLTREMNGAQVSLINFATQQLRGAQIGGLINYARKLDGLQIGLVNIADTSSGASIGLINWVTRGYHKLSISSNEVVDYQMGIKTGNAKLYSILLAGGTFEEGKRIYSAGLGFGHDFLFNSWLSLAPELSVQGLYLGNFDAANILTRGQLNLQFRLIKGISLFGGPSYSVYHTDPALASGGGFATRVGPAKTRRIGSTRRGWAGWNLGVTLF